MKPRALLLSLLLTLAGCPAWAEGEIVTGPDRRSEIDLRIEALDAERAKISTTGPKVATYLGLGMLVGGAVALGVAVPNSCPRYYYCPASEGGVIAGSTLIGIGTVSALTGGLIWNERARRRNEIDVERDSLIESRNRLAAALSRVELRSPYRNDTQFVTLGVRF